MRVGVFGGSFNPPHVGHSVVAETIRDTLKLDQVLWMPARRSPFKSASGLASDKHRLAMVRRAVAGNPAFEVDERELHRPPPSFTVHTLEALHTERADDDLFLLIGEDSLRQFDRWSHPERILELATLCVYPRGHESGETPSAWPHRFVEAPRLDIASSAIREGVRTGRSVRYLLRDAVLQYVEDHGLYRD